MKGLPLKTVTVGALSGALAFALLSLAHAQTQLSVHDLHQNLRSFVGHEITVTGLCGPVRHETKDGVEWLSFGIQEQNQKGKKTGYNVWIHLPSSAFSGQSPTENSNVSVTGTLKWPWTIATIEQR